jgi:hypothetical protein
MAALAADLGVLRTPVGSAPWSEAFMIGFEVTLNGRRLCTAGAIDASVLTTIVSFLGKRNELELEIGGLVDEAHLKWPSPGSLAVGDEVTVRIIETDRPDPPAISQRDDRALIEAGERKYYEMLKRKYEGQ